MIKEIKTNSKFYIAIILVIIIQLITLIYWMNQKSNYYVDELLSFSYSRLYGTEEPSTQYIHLSEDWVNDSWVKASDLRKYYDLNSDNDFFPTSLSRIADGFTKSRLYFMLLNLIRTLSGSVSFEKYPGIILNFIIFLLCQITLLGLAKDLNMRPLFTVLMIGMFGFCAMIISISEYVRFYLMTVLLLLLMLYAVSRFRKCKKVWTAVLFEILACVCAFVGMKNSELIIIFAGALFGFLIIDLIIRKQLSKILIHAGFMAFAAVYLFFRTSFISMLIHPEQYAGQKGIGSWIFTAILDISFRSLEEVSTFALETYSRFLFNGIPIMFIWVAALSVFFVLLSEKKAKDEQKISVTRVVIWAAWAVLSVLSLYLLRFRILMLVGFVIYTVWMFFPYFRDKLRSIHPSLEDGMVIMTAGACFVYTAFLIAAYMNNFRYFLFGIVSFIPVLWYGIDKGFEKLQLEDRKLKAGYGLLIGLSVITFVMPFFTRDVEYIYEGDRNLVNAVSDYQSVNPETNVVLVTDHDLISGDALDCIWQIKDGAEIYISDHAENEYKKADYPEEFLLWTADFRDMNDFLDKLKRDGYSYKEIGTDHVSRVYEVEK